jgi:hypothetical protein
MGIMTRRAVLHNPRAGPVGEALAVSTAHPIFMLSEMALSAHPVTVIHIHFQSFFGHQIIAFIFVMAGKTG